MLKKIKKYKSLLFSVSTYIWSALIPSLITIAINPFLAQNLSTKDYAIIGYYTSFNLIVLPVVTLSFINYYSRNFFLKNEQEKEELRNTLISSSLIFGPLLTGLCISIFIVYAYFNHINLPLFPYIFLSFIPNLFGYYFYFYQTQLKMEGKVKSYFKITLMNSLVMAFFSLLLVIIIKGEAAGRLGAILMANAIIAIYCLRKMFTRFQINFKQLKKCFAFSWPIILSSILYYFISSLDKVFLEKLNNIHEFGLYNIATQIIGYVGIISIAILQTFTPDIYKLTAQKNYQSLIKIALMIFVPSVIINLAFIPFSKFFISILTYNKFTEAYHYADILVFRNISYIAYFILSDILIGLGHTKFDFIIKFLGTICSIFIYYYGVQYFGFIGAAWSQSITLIIPVVFGLLFISILKKRFV